MCDMYDNLPERRSNRPKKDYFLWFIAAGYIAVPGCLGYVVGKQKGIAETTEKYKAAAHQTNDVHVISTQNPRVVPVDAFRTR